ncbi:MAG: hypothetical protein HY670_06150 [Chloroflexi bacterium]|nr:hypothetical protein [Chloroflexota bacterium]
MPVRPEWYDGYWQRLDKETVKKVRSSCSRCGSTETYYNRKFKVWRCIKCEHSFVIRGLAERPWWKRVFLFWKR